MSTPKKPTNQYLVALANASTTPAALQKLLAKLAIELEDAVYFNYPKADIKALEAEILDIQEAIASGAGDFEKTLRERHASYKPAERSSGYTYGPEQAGFAYIKPSPPENLEEGWRAAVGYRPVAPRSEAKRDEKRDALIKELEKRLKNLQFDLQDAVKFREPKVVIDQLQAQIAAVAAELDAARTQQNPPRRRNGKYFSKKPVDTQGRLIGRPYSRGILKREMETHPTMRSRMVGLIRWAGEKHGVSLRDATIKKMLGKAAKDLPARLRDIKRLADRAFYAGMRTMHALPGTEIVEPEPARGRRGKKTKVSGRRYKKANPLGLSLSLSLSHRHELTLTGGASNSVFKLSEKYLTSNTKVQEALANLYENPAEGYVSWMDYITVSIFPELDPPCKQFYRGEGPPLRDMLLPGQISQLDQLILAILKLITFIEENRSTMTWARVRIEIVRYFASRRITDPTKEDWAKAGQHLKQLIVAG